jgi:hypothetical protein
MLNIYGQFNWTLAILIDIFGSLLVKCLNWHLFKNVTLVQISSLENHVSLMPKLLIKVDIHFA